MSNPITEGDLAPAFHLPVVYQAPPTVVYQAPPAYYPY